jgi:hypothetical protein
VVVAAALAPNARSKTCWVLPKVLCCAVQQRSEQQQQQQLLPLPVTPVCCCVTPFVLILLPRCNHAGDANMATIGEEDDGSARSRGADLGDLRGFTEAEEVEFDSLHGSK